MIVFPNAKINIGLRIGGKRADGYHNLQTVFYPVPLYDVLEIIPNLYGKQDSFTQSGIPSDIPFQHNLVNKAIHLLRAKNYEIPPLDIHLHKNIPMGAGLGGGSADAAFTLKILNKLFRLNISDEKLSGYSLQLGSDCPFFILNKPASASGRGDELQPISLSLKDYNIVLILPQIHVSTAEAFKLLQNFSTDNPAEYLTLPVEDWKNHVLNDFEIPVFNMHPQLAEIKEELLNKGAVFAAMSGTGSALYGIFKETPPKLHLPEEYRQIRI